MAMVWHDLEVMTKRIIPVRFQNGSIGPALEPVRMGQGQELIRSAAEAVGRPVDNNYEPAQIGPSKRKPEGEHSQPPGPETYSGFVKQTGEDRAALVVEKKRKKKNSKAILR